MCRTSAIPACGAPNAMKQEPLGKIPDPPCPNPEKAVDWLRICDPLLKKYAYLLDYPDAYYDLQETLLDVLSKRDRLKNHSTGTAVNYIRKAIYHRYIALSKSQRRYTQSHILYGEVTEAAPAGYSPGAGIEDAYSFIDLDFLHSCLTEKECEILVLHFLTNTASRKSPGPKTSPGNRSTRPSGWR